MISHSDLAVLLVIIQAVFTAIKTVIDYLMQRNQK